MTKKELKKAYKKYAKENKTKGYMLCLVGGILVVAGALVVIPVAILSFLEMIDLGTHLGYTIPGLIPVLVGMVLDVIGEKHKSKEMKEFAEKQN